MRHTPKWIIGGTTAIAAAAIATGAAVPALAQQSGGHHQPIVLQRSSTTLPGPPKAMTAIPGRLGGTPVIVGPSGRTQAGCGITLVPTDASPDLFTVILQNPQPVSAVPTITGQAWTTGAPAS